MIQRYDLIRETLKHGKVKHAKKVAHKLPVAPPNIGPKTFPQLPELRRPVDQDAWTTARRCSWGSATTRSSSTSGPRSTRSTCAQGTGNQGQGKDDLSGYSTSATVLQIPERLVTRNGKPVSGPDARQRRGRGVVEHRPAPAPGDEREPRRQGHGKAHAASGTASCRSRGSATRWSTRWSSRSGQKDRFNRTTPDDDAANYGKFVTKPELAAILNALFGINAPETNRTDIVQALLQGIPDLNQHSGPQRRQAG